MFKPFLRRYLDPQGNLRRTNKTQGTRSSIPRSLKAFRSKSMPPRRFFVLFKAALMGRLVLRWEVVFWYIYMVLKVDVKHNLNVVEYG